MFKYITGLVFLAAALAAEIEDFESNLIEYEIPVHLRRGMSLPYPYQGSKEYIVPDEGAYYSGVYDTGVPSGSSLPKVSTEITKSKLGVIGTFASYAFALTKAAIMFTFANGLALIFGSMAALGVCKFTSICSKLSGLKSLIKAQQEFRSLVKPYRLARAAQFVQKALRKYNSMQRDK